MSASQRTRMGKAVIGRRLVRVAAVVALGLVVLAPWGSNVDEAAAGQRASGVVGPASTSGTVTVSQRASWRELSFPNEQPRDFDIRFELATDKAPTGAGQSLSLVARRIAGVGQYRLRLRLLADSRVQAVVVRRLPGSRRVIARQLVSGVTHRPDSFIAVRMRIEGVDPTVISLRAWPAGQREPSSWSIRVTDRAAQLARAGALAMRFALPGSSTNVPVSYLYQRLDLDAVAGDGLPAPTPSPSPTPPSPSPSPSASTVAPATPSPTPAATATPTPSPTASPTLTPAATPTPTPTSSITPTPTTSASPAIPSNAFFVSPAGSDTAAGTESAPWRTLQNAADSVPAGATVLARAGTYAGFRLRRSGTAGAPITFAAYPGEQAVVDGRDVTDYTVRLSSVSHVNLVGLTIRGGFMERQAGGGVLVENSSHVTVRDSALRDNKAFGVRAYNSTHVRIVGNEITGNAVGVRVNGAGEGIVIADNLIHHNTRMMINTADVADDDVGADGVELVGSTGRVLVKGNYVWGNRSPSHDYGYDGGAFAIHAASNWTITENVTWDNRNVLETGTDPSKAGCDNGIFTRNLNYGATTEDRTVGMVLRCASNTLVANNTFHGIQYFVFAMSHERGYWGGSVEGMRVLNNVISVSHGRAFGHDNVLPDSVVIDNNVVHISGSAVMAAVPGHGTTTSMATYRSWTGQQSHGLQADPRFADPTANDFRLGSDSPAVDAGRQLAGVTDGFLGAAPDGGYSERR